MFNWIHDCKLHRLKLKRERTKIDQNFFCFIGMQQVSVGMIAQSYDLIKHKCIANHLKII
jgi:hypothetical protein